MLIPSEAVQNQDQQVDNLLKSSRTIQVLGSEDFISVMSPKGAEEIIPAAISSCLFVFLILLLKYYALYVSGKFCSIYPPRD
jgi:hypothetical protein